MRYLLLITSVLGFFFHFFRWEHWSRELLAQGGFKQKQSAFRIYTHSLSHSTKDERLECNYEADIATYLHTSFLWSVLIFENVSIKLQVHPSSAGLDREKSCCGEMEELRHKLAGDQQSGWVLWLAKGSLWLSGGAYWTRSRETCALVPALPLKSSLTLNLI